MSINIDVKYSDKCGSRLDHSLIWRVFTVHAVGFHSVILKRWHYEEWCNCCWYHYRYDWYKSQLASITKLWHTHIDGTPCISALPCPLQNKHRVLHEKSAWGLNLAISVWHVLQWPGASSGTIVMPFYYYYVISSALLSSIHFDWHTFLLSVHLDQLLNKISTNPIMLQIKRKSIPIKKKYWW